MKAHEVPFEVRQIRVAPPSVVAAYATPVDVTATSVKPESAGSARDHVVPPFAERYTPFHVAANTSSVARFAGLVATSITKSKSSVTSGVPELVLGRMLQVSPPSIDL